MNFADRITEAMRSKKSRIVVGLDPRWEEMPHPLKEAAMAQHSMSAEAPGSHMWAVREFCEKIIEVTADIAVAFKPQIAFFERYGYTGLRVLERILKDHRDKLFIVDCKRGDIGSTSKAYAAAYFNHEGETSAVMPADAVTLNAYLGRDSLEPFFEHLSKDKGAFILAKTSNPSSADFQDQKVDGMPLYEHVARKVAEWGKDFIGECGYSSLGLVVGATFPEAARNVRKAAPRNLFLVPGLGAQGGEINDATAFCDEKGHGAIFNFARAIIYAYKTGPFKDEHPDEEYARAARIAAEHYRVQLNDVLGEL